MVFGIPPLGNRISYYRIGWQKSASQLWLIFDASAGTMIGPSFAGNACANGQDAMNKATRALPYLVESIVNSEGSTIRGSNCGLVKEASLYGTSSFG